MEEQQRTPRRRAPRKWLWLIPAVLLLAVLLLDSFYTLKEDQFAVITTFGKPSTVSASGLQLKLPFIQRVKKVSKSVQGFPLGYRVGSNASYEEESLMITYDYNFVNVDFYVEYRVTDPVKYLYNSSAPEDILKMLCQSYIRDTIGLYNVDSVITTGKSEIQAFTAVETAKQSADTAVNNAKKYANEVTPAAEADADEIIKQAEAYRAGKINEATGQAARFAELFAEYQNYPLITKQRLFYETMEQVLPDMKLYILDESTGVQTMLPLESFAALEGGN